VDGGLGRLAGSEEEGKEIRWNGRAYRVAYMHGGLVRRGGTGVRSAAAGVIGWDVQRYLQVYSFAFTD
jgi:hypothetical protein